MNLIDVVKNVGENDISVQVVDNCMCEYRETKKTGTRLTIQTEQSLNSFGVVFWFEREALAKFIEKANKKNKTIGLDILLKEFGSTVKAQMLDTNIQRIQALKKFNKITFITDEKFKPGTLGLEKFGLIAWCNRAQVKEVVENERDLIEAL